MTFSTKQIRTAGYICCGVTDMLACNSQTVKKQAPVRPTMCYLYWSASSGLMHLSPGKFEFQTPCIDQLASEGVQFINAISGMSGCTPAKASIMTGQRPLTNGVFMNDVQLDTNAVSFGKVMSGAGYETAYIGKWHLDGMERKSFISKGRRQNFDYWNALEHTHNYNHLKLL